MIRQLLERFPVQPEFVVNIEYACRAGYQVGLAPDKPAALEQPYGIDRSGGTRHTDHDPRAVRLGACG